MTNITISVTSVLLYMLVPTVIFCFFYYILFTNGRDREFSDTAGETILAGVLTVIISALLFAFIHSYNITLTL